VDTAKVLKWISNIEQFDGDALSLGSLRTIGDIKKEVAALKNVEPPFNSAAMVSAIVAHEKCGIAPTKVERYVEHFEWNIAIDNDHTATLTMSQDDFMALQQAGRQQQQHAITNRDCNAKMVGSNDAGILGDDYEIGDK